MGVDDQAAAQDRCECGADPGDINFDRSICACGSMHYFCNQCGTQAEPCSDESPAASSGDDVTLGDIEEHEMWEEHTRERVEQMREASSAAHGRRHSLARVGWAHHSDFMRTALQETGRIRLSFITLADLWAVVDDLGIDPEEIGFYRGYAVVGDAWKKLRRLGLMPERPEHLAAHDLREPNARLMGEHVVRADTTLAKSGCQAVEFLTNFSRPDGVPEGWHSCGLPPFATVYAGQYDDEEHEDIQPVLCWKHLLALGNTGDLVVRRV